MRNVSLLLGAALGAALGASISRHRSSGETPVTNQYGPDPDVPPRRLSVEPTSKFYHPCVKRVEVIFNGARRHGDVVEYDADAGWIDVHRRDRRGRPLTQNGEWAVMHLWGTVEPVWRENLPSPQPRRHRQAAITDHDAHMQRADEKRARKAAQLQAKWDRDHA